MKKTPIAFRVALISFQINAMIWFVFGVLVGLGVIPLPIDSAALRWILSSLAIIGSVVLLVLYRQLERRTRNGFYFSVIVLLALVVLTFMDQFGLADLVYLVIELVSLFLLMISSSWYFQSNTHKKSG